MRQQIPNFFTALNLFFGCVSIYFIFTDDIYNALIFTALSLVADYVDGMAARWLKVSSPIGVELDSLADVVSFGVAPGFIFFLLLGGFTDPSPVTFSGLLIPVFAAFRLAKFNLDTRQTDHFLGLATPACTIFIAGLWLIFHEDALGLKAFISSKQFLLPTIVALCWLMISEVPMFSLKFKKLGWAGNEIRFIFAAVALLSVIFLKFAAPAVVILLYVVISILQKLVARGS